jgi:hypothetical protein
MAEFEATATEQRLERLLAIARMTLRTVAARAAFRGTMQTGMISIQVSIVLLGGLHQQLQDRDELDLFDGETRDWLCFGGLLGVLDAEAWRMLGTEGDDGIAEIDLADFEHGLRQLITHGERVLARLRDAEAAGDTLVDLETGGNHG